MSKTSIPPAARSDPEPAISELLIGVLCIDVCSQSMIFTSELFEWRGDIDA